MSLLSDLSERVRAFVFRARQEREMDEEMRFHLDMATEQLRRAGVDVAEARRRGQLAFGGLERVKEETRDARGTRWLEDFLADIGRSARTLWHSPRLSIVAILILAIGIGGTTAVFSAVDAVLLKPLPYQQPGQLVRLYQYWEGNPDGREWVTGIHYLTYRSDVGAFSALTALDTYNTRGADIGTGVTAERIRLLPVTADYFDVMRAQPVLGRGFERSEEVGAPVVILSHQLWERLFGGRANVVGSSLTMSGVPRTIVGVMPAGFEDPLVRSVDAWVPEDLRPIGDAMDPGNHYLTVVGRLRPTVTIQHAQTELNTLSHALEHQYPQAGKLRALLVPLRDDVVGPASRTLELMLGAVGLVLVLVCVNIANLLLVRGSERAREFALRAALGARGSRLLRLSLAESIVLALAGGVVGVGLARTLSPLIVALGRNSIPRLASLSIDWLVLGFAFLVAAASAIVFGLAPGLRAARALPGDVMRETAQTASGSPRFGRLRSALVVSQVALALVLVVGAGLLLASVSQLRRIDLGVSTDDVLTFDLNLPAARYDSTARARFYDDFAHRVEALPGVRAVGGISRLPATGSYNSWSTGAASGPLAGVTNKNTPSIEQRIISGDYFRAVGMHEIAGRTFDDRDGAAAPPRVVISASAAAKLFPGIDPLGQQLTTANVTYTVIGVVNDVALDAEGDIEPCIYHAHRQFAGDRNWALTQLVATAGPPEQREPTIRTALAAMDPQLVMYRPTTLAEAIGQGRAQRVFTLRILVSFAVVALLLAALGLFGVLSYTVRLRAREIGIRMALGADVGAIRTMVLHDAGIVTGLGMAIGILGAVGLSRLMASIIFHVSPLDPVVIAGAIGVMALVAAGAAYLPAYRASHLAPRTVLQGE